ncbi:uncharacterized protein LOC144106281 isoform X2 [Amblyomma americanum]
MEASAGTLLCLSTLIFTMFTIVQGYGLKSQCDVQGVSACYWAVGVWYGRMPFADNVPEDRNEYLASLCQIGPEDFPVNATCKALYGSCSDDEKRKFTRMEAGYSALQDATRATKACESIVLLRQCLDLDEMLRCNVIPYIEDESFETLAWAHERGAQNLKTCLVKAAESCKGNQPAVVIERLEKVADAIIDLSSLSESQSGASIIKYSVAIVGGALLSLSARQIYS